MRSRAQNQTKTTLKSVFRQILIPLVYKSIMKNFLLLFLFTVAVSSAQQGSSLHFDGANDYIEKTNCVNLPQGNSPRTIEAWIRSGANGRSIVNYGTASSNQRSGLVVSSSGKLYYVGESNDLSGYTGLNDNKWHHVAAVYTGGTTGTLTLYVDGIFDNSSVKNFSTTGTTIRLGQRVAPLNGEFYSGHMDEVRIWNRALCPAEIVHYMNCQPPPNAPNLVAYYNFNQGIAYGTNTGVNTLTDNSPSANTATLLNFALTGTTSNWTPSTSVNSNSNCNLFVPLTLSVSGTEVCSGISTTISASGASTFTWTNLSGSVISTSSLAVISPTSNVVYQVAGTHTFGCTSVLQTSVLVVTNPSVIANSSNTLICIGQSATLTANGATSYTWSGGAGNLSLAVVSPSSTTTYSLYGSNACGSNSTTVVQNVSPCTSVSENQPLSDVIVCPNPNRGRFEIKSPIALEVRIYNALGQTVFLDKLSESSMLIDLKENPAGLYFISLNTGNARKDIRVIVE